MGKRRTFKRFIYELPSRENLATTKNKLPFVFYVAVVGLLINSLMFILSRLVQKEKV